MEHSDYRNIRGNLAAKKFFRGRPISLARQAHMLEQAIQGSSAQINNGTLIWIGEVNPTPMSCTYKIEIQYSLATFPAIWVLNPTLKRRIDEEAIPHMYEQERLCLYFPPTNEWNNTKLLSRTVLPWSALWLMFYEYWHVTGLWNGGGIHIDIDAMESDYDGPNRLY